MYKVFYNQKPIHFTVDLEKNTAKSPLFYLKYANAKSIIKALKDKKVKEVYLYHSNAKKMEKHFFKIFPIVEAAGGFVKHQNGKYLFIYRNDKWDLPKGKLEKKEKIIDAAVREVCEETGVENVEVIKPLPTTFHIYNANGKHKIKKTYWFLMHSSFEGTLAPQTEENIQQAVWKSKSEFSDLMQNAYENIKLIVKNVL